MATDREGRRLEVGDVVMIPCEVVSVSEGNEVENVALQACHPSPRGGRRGFMVNGGQVVKQVGSAVTAGVFLLMCLYLLLCCGVVWAGPRHKPQRAPRPPQAPVISTVAQRFAALDRSKMNDLVPASEPTNQVAAPEPACGRKGCGCGCTQGRQCVCKSSPATSPQEQAQGRAGKAKTCGCSTACTCGCNDGEECSCATLRTATVPYVPAYTPSMPPPAWYGGGFGGPMMGGFGGFGGGMRMGGGGGGGGC